MANLSNAEKRKFERMLRMGDGYVLDFSNRTFNEFVFDSTSRNIYDPRYMYGSGSKANLLRGFWREEPNRVVVTLLNDLLDYANEQNLIRDEDAALEEACGRTILRLRQESPVPELDALVAITEERDFEVVVKAVRDAIEKSEPEAGLDRLHTYVVKYVRTRCEQHGAGVSRDKPLHSIFGEYVKKLRQSAHIESEMAERILRSTISILESFNDVRNNQSLAHDNPVLQYEEALLIFNHVTSSIRFLESIETKYCRAQNATDDRGVQLEEDIPF